MLRVCEAVLNAIVVVAGHAFSRFLERYLGIQLRDDGMYASSVCVSLISWTFFERRSTSFDKSLMNTKARASKRHVNCIELVLGASKQIPFVRAIKTGLFLLTADAHASSCRDLRSCHTPHAGTLFLRSGSASLHLIFNLLHTSSCSNGFSSCSQPRRLCLCFL